MFPMGRKPIPPSDPNNLTDREKNRISVREYQQRNKEAANERSRQYRETHKDYFRQKKKEERERVKNDPQYRAQELLRVKRHYQKNRVKLIAASKAYADSHVEGRKAYRKANSERRTEVVRAWRAKDPERHKATAKKWRQANMPIIRNHIALRRAREINATIGDPRAIVAWEKEWKSRTINTCEWCRMEVPTEICVTEHAEPLVKGGAHNLDNLVISCAPCNRKKGRKSLEKWLEILGRDE